MSFPQINSRKPQPVNGFDDCVHPLIKRLLSQRGLQFSSEINHELNQLHDPFLMLGMQEAVDRLYRALTEQQKIIIVGDYDADGATSTTLMLLVLQKMGFKHVNFMVPNRFEYGYGLSSQIVEELSVQAPQVLVTVDNGISSIDGVALANDYGIDVIVTDHHLPGEQLPKACAIINPNQQGCEFPSKALAGVGVAFHLLMALRKHLREQAWFSDNNIEEPNLANYLDLVAIGTVADVVPLDQCNRVLVAQGIKRMRAGIMRPGIRHLLQVSGKDYRHLLSSDMGFTLGPRLNAVGRLDDMTTGILLLTTESEDLALELAQMLDGLNKDRRLIEQQMQSEAMTIVDTLMASVNEVPRGFCLFHPDWHQGVVGLVASRLKEKFHRPVIAFARADGDNNELKGSGRSIAGIHLRDLLDEIATDKPGLLEKFGGHAMAAGLSLAEENFELFHAAYLQQLNAIADTSLFAPTVDSDGAIDEKDMNLFTAKLIEDAMPWGQGMPEPVFDGEFYLFDQRLLAGKHLKLKLGQTESKQALVDGIHFNCDLELWPSTAISKVRLIYRLSVNRFRGEEQLQMMIQYIEPVAV